jgi:hypothetical protein
LSRLWLLLLWGIPLAGPAWAQPIPDPTIATILENGKRLTAIEKKRCPQPTEDDEIVVCADPGADQDQLVFQDRPSNEDRIRPGEAISTTKAAQCIGGYPACAHRLHQLVGTKFGNVPPPAIPFAEVIKGLPEPDMVVQEGDGESQIEP